MYGDWVFFYLFFLPPFLLFQPMCVMGVHCWREGFEYGVFGLSECWCVGALMCGVLVWYYGCAAFRLLVVSGPFPMMVGYYTNWYVIMIPEQKV